MLRPEWAELARRFAPTGSRQARWARHRVVGGHVQQGSVLWFTGYSGAGKSTVAGVVLDRLRTRGVAVELLDGDEVRTNLSKGLSFSREDRDINVRRIGWVAGLLS